MKAFAIANQKGGVGKTTVARNLFFYSIERGYRTLGVDFDSQGNFTKTLLALRERSLGLPGAREKFLTSSKLFKKSNPSLKPMDCGNGGALISADSGLLDVGSFSMNALQNPRALLREYAQDFDVCVIDTPPTLGKPLYAALIASNFVICPCTVDEDATDGLAKLFEEITHVQQLGWNSELVPLGVLANCVNSRRTTEIAGLEQLKQGLGDLLLDTVLWERAATKDAKYNAVWQATRGESRSLAAKEMKAACSLIFEKATV